MNNESRARAVFINTISGVGGFTASALIGLALTPYLIYRLGFEQYGFWIVLSTAVNYVGLLDLGVETTFIKYVAEYAATDQWARVRQVVTFGVAFYCLLALMFAPLAYAGAPVVVGWMKVSPHLGASGPRFFALITSSYFLTCAAGVVGSLLTGIGYLRYVNGVTVLSRLAFAVAAVAFTTFGMSIDGLIAATFVQIALAAVAFYALGRVVTGAVFTAPWCLEARVIKKLFKLGGWIQVTNLASTITMETNRLIIAVFVQTAAVTTYEIANKLTRAMRSLPFNFVVALLPAVSAMDALSGGEDFNRVYVRAARYLNAATLFLVGFVMAAVVPICRLWLGTTYPQVSEGVLFLGCAFIIVNFTAIGTCMLRAIGQAKYEAFYFLCFALATITAIMGLVHPYKLTGVLAGTLIGSAVSTAYFLWLFHRLRSLPFGRGFFSWLWKLLLAAASAIAATCGATTIFRPALFHERPGAAIEVALLACIYSAAFALLLWATRFFDSADGDTLAHIMPARLRVMASNILPASALARGRP